MIRGLLGRNYILLWLGQFVSQMGNRLYLMALAWYFVSVADDSAGLFTVFIVSSLPSLFLGPFIGPLVERWNKKRIMVCCDLVSAGLVGLLGWIVSRDAASNYAIYAICFALNSVNLLFSPAINSIIPAILPPEKYQAGMSYIKMITFLGQILGAAVGGILVGFLGVYLTIVVNAVSFFLSGLSEMFIRFRPPAVRRSGNYAGALKAGINYVRRSPVVRRVLSVSVACNLFIPALMVFLPIVIKTQMGLDAKAYGLADAMMPAGAVFVAVLLARRRSCLSPGRVLSIGLGGLSVAFLLTACVPVYSVVLFSVFAYGCFTNFINIQIVTYFLKTVDPDYQGRFFSLLESFSYASISLSYLLATVISGYYEVTAALLVNAAGLLLLALAALSPIKQNANRQ